MTEAAGSEPVQDLVDRLEEDVVDVDKAAEAGSDGEGDDTTGSVPGTPEPPD